MKKLLVLLVSFFVGTLFWQAVVAETVSDQAPPIVTRVTGNCGNGLIQARILTLYSVNPILKDFNIQVEADDGVVTLTGTLQNAAQKDLALTIASDIEGVRDVKCKISVDPRTKRGEKPYNLFQKIGDATITATIKTALLTSTKVNASNIKVTTINSVVTLDGNVNSENEKRIAGNIAADTIGVSSIKNNLNVIKNR